LLISVAFNDARPRTTGRRALSYLAMVAALAGCAAPLPAKAIAPQSAEPVVQPVAQIGYRISARYPHDITAFTQGLFWRDGLLFESTGLKGQSRIVVREAKTGKLIRQRRLDPRIFGEGIAPAGDRLVSLTWMDERGFIWLLDDFAPLGAFSYEGEGWGLAATPTELVMSDGSATLRFLDPDTLAVKRLLAVTLDGAPMFELNELEWVDGVIYANVWRSDLIVRIDPASGRVTGTIDISALTVEAGGDMSVKTPNGIAWDPVAKQLLVTGKLWPTVFALTLD